MTLSAWLGMLSLSDPGASPETGGQPAGWEWSYGSGRPNPAVSVARLAYGFEPGPVDQLTSVVPSGVTASAER